MKHVPNALTIFRLLMVIPMLLLEPFSAPFMTAYILGGTSDIIDGPIARKFNVATQFGAALDGGVDLIFLFAALFRMAPVVEFSNWLWIWIGIAIFLKLLATVIGYIRHKQMIFLHTLIGKFFMLNLLLFPVYYLFLSADQILIVLLVIVSFIVIEDIYINATSTEVNLDYKGILFEKLKK